MGKNYSDKHQRKGKTDYEFLLDRMRNHYSPLKTYFELKKKINDGKIERAPKIEEILRNLEKQCMESSDKIIKLLKEK
jgi:hypothetical protein